MVGSGAETGFALAAALLVGSAYGTLAVIGGGLYLAHRRSVRREVERLLDSLSGSGVGESIARRRARAPGGRERA